MSVDTPLHIVTADLHTLALSIRASCLVFEDLASRALLERVQQIASSDTTALIIGETGTVQLPPLRERPGDILPLVHHFLKIYGTRLGYATADLAPEAVQQQLDYPWPGNIRELENTIHDALLVCPGHIVRPEDLRLPTPRSQQPPAMCRSGLEQGPVVNQFESITCVISSKLRTWLLPPVSIADVSRSV